ncbi:DUF1054 domain-containing protein [Paenibacillus thailandensis]|uniref:UPF0637 protein ACFSW5_12620 n=1 Tax=Paenibacillus thailandensis TaxID=393250 RepID=A0ABW5QXD5_9BACL
MHNTSEAPSTFEGFRKADFETFHIEGLEGRMEAIQNRIQPKFKLIGEELAARLSPSAGREMFLHISKHARRTVNPPKDTWLAICHNKRGYKAHPHFQLGLFDDHLFLWFALIYELPNKSAIASAYLNDLDKLVDAVPQDYVLSADHMQKAAVPVASMDKAQWRETLVRFRDVKKAELLIGKHIEAGNKLVQDGPALLRYAELTFESLMPLYRMAISQI